MKPTAWAPSADGPATDEPCTGYDRSDVAPDGLGSVCWTRTADHLVMHTHGELNRYLRFVGDRVEFSDPDAT